jgi:hypothetical protein
LDSYSVKKENKHENFSAVVIAVNRTAATDLLRNVSKRNEKGSELRSRVFHLLWDYL